MADNEDREGFDPSGKPLPKVTDQPVVVPVTYDTPQPPKTPAPWEPGGSVPEAPEGPAPAEPEIPTPRGPFSQLPPKDVSPEDLAEKIARKIIEEKGPDLWAR